MFNWDTGSGFHYDMKSKNHLTTENTSHNVKLVNKGTNDGGPGSGNWGHAGRKGKLGGSGKGTGGKKYRLTTPSGGFTSRAQAEKENKQRSKASGSSGGGGGSNNGGSSNETSKTNATAKNKNISSKEDFDAALKAMKAKDPNYNTDTTVGHEKTPHDIFDVKAQCGVDFFEAGLMAQAAEHYSKGYDQAIKKAVTSDRKEYEAAFGNISYDDCIRDAKWLESFIARSPKVTGRIMRGNSYTKEKYDELMKKVQAKETIQAHGFSSWTTRQKTAESFAKVDTRSTYSVIHVLNNGTIQGTSMQGLSKFKSEEEIIVSGNEKRRFTGNIWTETMKGKEVTFIEEEEILE